jgi:hypothetical protein
MTTTKNPAPRWRAGNQAYSKVEQQQIIASSVDWEADPAAIWFARWFAPADGACAPSGRAGEPREGVRMSCPTEAIQDIRDARAGLLRDFVFEALAPVESDAPATRLCLKNDDDAGARYHLKRVVECVKAAASTFRELEALVGRGR